MESLIDILFDILLFTLLLNQFWQITKLLGQFRSGWNSCATWLMIVFVAVGLYAALELNQALVNQELVIYRFASLTKLQSGLAGLAIFSGFCIIILAVIREVSAKKVKTLWRLPIIGLLLGFLLEANQVIALWLLTELFIWVVLFNRRAENPLLFRINIKSMLVLLVCLGTWAIVPEKKWLLMLLFYVYYYYRIVLLHTVLIRQWMKQNE